jgi:hypothetical protein
MLHNAEEGYLSPGPTGGSLESQLCVTTFEKGITLLFMLCLNLTSERASESSFSGSLGISESYFRIGKQDKREPQQAMLYNLFSRGHDFIRWK